MKEAMHQASGSDRDSSEPANIESLLNSEAWHERLRKARAQREKILAERGGADPATPGGVVSILRPAPWKDGEDEPEPLPNAHLPDFSHAPAAPPMPRPMPPAAVARPVPPHIAPATPAPAPAPVAEPRRSRTGLVAGGFALGLAAGVGIALYLASPDGAETAALAPEEAAAPAMPGTAAAPVPAAVALPEASTEIAAPSAPDQSGSDLPTLASEPGLPTHTASPDALSLGTAKADPNPESAAPLPAQPVILADIAAPPAQSLSATAAQLGAALEAGPLPTPAAVLTAAMPADAAPVADTAYSPSPYDRPAPRPAPEPDPVVMAALERVMVHVLAPPSMPEAELSEFAATLGETGLNVLSPARVPYTISQTHVRYYHAEDADVATLLAEEAGGDARDFTGFSPLPPDGTIEIWVAGQAPKQRSKAPATARRAPAPQDPLRSLHDRLILQLRRGDHL